MGGRERKSESEAVGGRNTKRLKLEASNFAAQKHDFISVRARRAVLTQSQFCRVTDTGWTPDL